jgi:hypothetical protein
MQNFDRNINFREKRQFFLQKFSKIAENCDHNIDPRLGDFSPHRQSFTLGSFFENYRSRYINKFGLFFFLRGSVIPFPVVIFFKQVEIGIRHHYHHSPLFHQNTYTCPIIWSLAIYTPYLIFWAILFHGKIINFDIKWIWLHFGWLFTNSSGRPDCGRGGKICFCNYIHLFARRVMLEIQAGMPDFCRKKHTKTDIYIYIYIYIYIKWTQPVPHGH